jgi:hypothetical protein
MAAGFHFLPVNPLVNKGARGHRYLFSLKTTCRIPQHIPTYQMDRVFFSPGDPTPGNAIVIHFTFRGIKYVLIPGNTQIKIILTREKGSRK